MAEQQAGGAGSDPPKRQVCFQYSSHGQCDRGDNCQYLHERIPQQCRQWKTTGHCSFGHRCHNAASHLPAPRRRTGGPPQPPGSQPGTQQAAPGQGDTKQTQPSVAKTVAPTAKKSTSALYPVTAEYGWGDEEASPAPPIAIDALWVSPPHSAPECVATVNRKVPPRRGVLGWDSHASIHVASSLDLLPDAAPLAIKLDACGVGGTRPITHAGVSPLFNLHMSYIEGGHMPNLMSLGRELQTGKVAVFTGTGAVRFRDTPRTKRLIQELIDAADEDDLVEGIAHMRNYVYEEDFGDPGNVSQDREQSSTEAAEAYAVSVNMFANRIHLDRVDDLIAFLDGAGLSKDAMLAAVRDKTVKGLPTAVTAENIEKYFRTAGKDTHQLEADITAAPLRVPRDYDGDTPPAPGEIVQIDSIDAPFARKKVPDTVAPDGHPSTKWVRQVVPSLGSYKDAWIAIDQASSFVYVDGRVTKKDPHKIVLSVVERWHARWGNLKIVKADKEYVTRESERVVNNARAVIRQSVPGDHRRNTGLVEGCIRWIQDLAQGSMNRLRPLVKDKVISADQMYTLWFHALRHASIAWNLRPSFCDRTKSRLEHGTGEVANLSYRVMMPFGMRLVSKNLTNDAEGRGSECLYLGPSMAVRGGILTFNTVTSRVSVKYSFVHVPPVQRPTPDRLRRAA